VGNGSFFSEDNIDYHLKWLKGARSTHNLTIDYMGTWLEHPLERRLLKHDSGNIRHLLAPI
jgi:galactosylceramidase